MSARDDYPFHASFDPLPGLLLPDEHAEMLSILDEIDRLRSGIIPCPTCAHDG